MTISQHMPDVYDVREGSDLSDLSAAIDQAVETSSQEIDSFLQDLGLLTADGEGLDYTGANYDVARSPGMGDTRYAACIEIIAGGRRCTTAIIRALLEAATGLTWIVKDRQDDLDEHGGVLFWGIPLFEVWAQAIFAGSSYGLAYASYDTHVDFHPVESGIAGPVIDAQGQAGGEFNDHTFSPIDWWTLALLERMRPAGVKVVFKEFYP